MKITGEIQGKSLHEILGKKSKVLGVSDIKAYAAKIEKMETEKLFVHGMEEFGIKPSLSSSRNRKVFEKRCLDEFRKAVAVIGGGNDRPRQPERPKNKKLNKALEEVLRKGV